MFYNYERHSSALDLLFTPCVKNQTLIPYYSVFLRIPVFHFLQQESNLSCLKYVNNLSSESHVQWLFLSYIID